MAYFPSRSASLWLALAVLPGPAAAQAEKTDLKATREYAVAAGLESRHLYAQAARRWQQFVQAHPKHPRLVNAYHHLGTCQLHDKQPGEAAKTFRILIEKFPAAASLDAAHFNLGLALYHVGLASGKADDLRAAARAFAAVPARFTRSKHVAPSLYYQGECLYRAGDLTGAVALYQKVIREHPGSDVLPDAYCALGTTQHELAQDREASATFQTFLAKFPRDRLAGECRLRLGLSLFRQKRYPEAG